MTQQRLLWLPLIFLMATSCAPRSAVEKQQRQIEAINQYMEDDIDQLQAIWALLARVERMTDMHEKDLADMSLQLNMLKELCNKKGRK